MLIPGPVLDELATLLAGPADRRRVASVPTDIDPLHLVRAGSRSFGPAVYFGVPGGGELGGIGAAWQFAASGPDRLARLDAAIAGERFPADVRLAVGFSFADDGSAAEEWTGYPAAAALLPLVSVVAGASTRHLTIALPAGVGAAGVLDGLRRLPVPSPPRVPEAAAHVIEAYPSPADWRDTVAEAIAAIRAGALQKVVLARSVVVRGEDIADPFGLVEQLRAHHQDFYAYGWQQGDAVFLGASPELLVARSGVRVRSHPFAGTAPRGADEAADDELGQKLMASAKNRREHRYVIEDIADRLRPLTASLDAPGTPTLRRMPDYHHLSTEIAGVLAEPVRLLDLAARLHPTPAVGGIPRQEALAYMDKVESVPRGWYSGGIGWADPVGDGEVALALRCALVRGAEARLYAGNGIVADSDPESELAETRLKFRALVDLLAAT